MWLFNYDPLAEDPLPGEYKKRANFVMRVDTENKGLVAFRFVHPEDVRDHLAELVKWIGQHEDEVGSFNYLLVLTTQWQVHPIQLAAVGHYNFVRTPPFQDGNGRVARLFMNLLFLRRNFNPAVIEPTDREKYMLYLAQADKGDLLPITEFIGSALVKTQENLLSLDTFTRWGLLIPTTQFLPQDFKITHIWVN